MKLWKFGNFIKNKIKVPTSNLPIPSPFSFHISASPQFPHLSFSVQPLFLTSWWASTTSPFHFYFIIKTLQPRTCPSRPSINFPFLTFFYWFIALVRLFTANHRIDQGLVKIQDHTKLSWTREILIFLSSLCCWRIRISPPSVKAMHGHCGSWNYSLPWVLILHFWNASSIYRKSSWKLGDFGPKQFLS